MEITGYIYQLDENINYNKYDNVIKGEIELKENSNFWLFFHCDDNYNFNNKTAVIILSRKHNKNFISLGCFIQSEKEYEFMIFKNLFLKKILYRKHQGNSHAQLTTPSKKF